MTRRTPKPKTLKAKPQPAYAVCDECGNIDPGRVRLLYRWAKNLAMLSRGDKVIPVLITPITKRKKP
jgi:hypothetical protein